MTASKTFRNTAGAAALVAATGLVGCASPTGPMGVGEVRPIGVPFLNDNLIKEQLEARVRTVRTGPGCSTCPVETVTTEESRQVLVRDSGVLGKATEIFQGVAYGVGAVAGGLGAYRAGAGGEKYGEAAEKGALATRVNNVDNSDRSIHNATTSGAQSASESNPVVSPTITTTSQGGMGGMGGSSSSSSSSTTGPITATGGSTGPVTATGGSATQTQGQQQGQQQSQQQSQQQGQQTGVTVTLPVYRGAYAPQ